MGNLLQQNKKSDKVESLYIENPLVEHPITGSASISNGHASADKSIPICCQYCKCTCGFKKPFSDDDGDIYTNEQIGKIYQPYTTVSYQNISCKIKDRRSCEAAISECIKLAVPHNIMKVFLLFVAYSSGYDVLTPAFYSPEQLTVMGFKLI